MANNEPEKTLDGIAIVGMAGRFPEAANLDAFWENLLRGRESVHLYSDDELAAAGVDGAALRQQGYVAAAASIADVDKFDAAFFGYTAEQAELIDPQQRLFLEVAWEALENAGRDPRRIGEQTGVFAGQGNGNYLLFNLAARLNSTQYFQTIVANGADFLSSRLAFVCGLNGPSIGVQTACSTGMSALHIACQSLLNYECGAAVAGAVSLQLLPVPGYFHDGGKSNLSTDGHTRVFDHHASGALFGDGCGVLVLRRLEDALADGDPIRAVIRGSAINSSGAVAGGFSAPSAKAQEDVATEALSIAGVKPSSIGYLEMSGAANTIGDAIEVTALARAFRKGASAGNICGIGAVKSNVGHLGAAASMASLCKTVLVIENGEIPPTINVERVNPSLSLEQTPFHLVLAPEPFPPLTPKRAAVNSYGIGGTNVHVVLEEAPARDNSPSTPGPHLLTLSAATPTALRTMSNRLAAHLESHRDVNLADAAFTLATGRTPLLHRRAIVCRDVNDAIARLKAAGGEGTREAASPRIPADADVNAIAALWVRGADVDWAALFGEDRRRIALPTYPFEGTRHWIDIPNRNTLNQSSDGEREARLRDQPARRTEPAVQVRRDSVLVPPSTELEATLCKLWSEATGAIDVGVDDNFFAIGGSSLALTDVHAKLRSTVIRDLTIVDVFSNPTVRTLAAQIERVQADPSAAGVVNVPVGDLAPSAPGKLAEIEMAILRAEARLADDVRPARAHVAAEPRNILLTGATGFLGVYLLKELIEQTTATIYCHVRAADAVSGLERLRKAMKARWLWNDAYVDRIVPVCGDLGDAKLGVSPAAYVELSETIDTIVHNGATVNFTPPYPALRKVNVVGTEDILRFACTNTTKTVHFVSSTGTWGGRFPVDEMDPLDDIAGLENGYTQSKWVAERLVQTAAERGLPVTIHRPPRVVGDTRTGSANLEDFVARVIKGCAELGACPAGHFFDIFSPVDFVARAIVAISRSPEALTRQRFHIVHPKLITWRTVFNFMPTVGIPLEVVPYAEWRKRLIAFCQDHDNALKTLLPLFRAPDDGGYAEISEDFDLSLLPEVPSANAAAVLAAAGIEPPVVDRAVLTTHFNYFFESGFIASKG